MIPEGFLSRMKDMLGEEFEAFEASLSQPSVRGIRVNTAKISVADFLEKTTLTLSPIDYAEDGFIPEDCEGIGKTAEHHAGMFYVQDPGAMATVKALDIQPGWRVLDACAAPGGKASQLAAAIGEDGFLLANEYVPKRAKIIVSNFERLGIKNAVVTSLDTSTLGETYPCYFDLVLCDAPCSGEGMFRKYEEAVSEWSEENVRICAERQRKILKNLARAVRPGGYLLYSTCTYSREENEDMVADFLKGHPEFSLCEVNPKLIAATADGLDGMVEARRFYPHLSRGEGQFIALMKKDENSPILTTKVGKDALKPANKADITAFEKFAYDNLFRKPEGKITVTGEYLVLVNHENQIPAFSTFMSGVILGEVKKGNFFPHHQFFSAYGQLFKRREELKAGDAKVEKYLRGEEIAASFTDSGWCCVTYEGVALGGGKASGGRIKNHYPKGLRNN